MPFYAGFDTDIFPGQLQLDWLKSNTNLSWCGYYLAPAPNHPDDSWMGNRQALIEQGWGLLPIYVGQQAGSNTLTDAQGTADGSQAAHLARAEGFPRDGYLYIDWEDGSPLDADSQAYLGAWAAEVVKNGYQPGVYCSHDLADSIASLMAGLNPPPELRIWAWNVPTTNPQPYLGPLGAFPAVTPAGCGYVHAMAWQHLQNCVLMPGALQVDLSASNLKDPSAPSISRWQRPVTPPSP
ncbi:glycoside hydrolase domain-containing protein [Burkholderia sp. MSMB1589WGS]|uniref:glycoside hydrolase domain-containing protein n=1 Tax=Burkholderia sp. MSMB1589WGS TaxID=1636425 RepID=UPI0007B9C6EA|nr:glycoside hydrolase domain-containing protein [Burkholderia sp. MSMB1589WGS]